MKEKVVVGIYDNVAKRFIYIGIIGEIGQTEEETRRRVFEKTVSGEALQNQRFEDCSAVVFSKCKEEEVTQICFKWMQALMDKQVIIEDSDKTKHIYLIYDIRMQMVINVGQAFDVRNRMWLHKSAYNHPDSVNGRKAMYVEMRKHRFEDLILFIVETIPLGIVDEREQLFIKMFDTVRNGTNTSVGGSAHTLISEDDVDKVYDYIWMGITMPVIAKKMNRARLTLIKRVCEKYPDAHDMIMENRHRALCKTVYAYRTYDEPLVFESERMAAAYVAQSERSKTKSITSIEHHISMALNSGRMKYGLYWTDYLIVNPALMDMKRTSLLIEEHLYYRYGDTENYADGNIFVCSKEATQSVLNEEKSHAKIETIMQRINRGLNTDRPVYGYYWYSFDVKKFKEEQNRL